MIADTSTQLRQVAETFITMPEIRSRFLEQMEYNMKARAGINPSISNEEIANKRNEQIEEDNLAATENTLTQIDYSNPETLQSVLQNYRTYGTLMKSNPVTAVIESFTDNEIADKIISDDVYRINATNTDQDYPVYMTRGAIFATQLLDKLNNDSPSISSFVKRFAIPPALAVAGHMMKSGVGLFVTHGATAAYDVTQLGTSIYNTQKKYHDWRNRLLDDKTLGYDQFMEETQKLLDDVVSNVPEEYRYEVYKGLYEGPDPFADIGNAFTGFGTDMAYIPAKAGYGFAKGTIKNIMPGIKQSTNVKKLDLNVDIVNKIKEMSTNKVNEEAVEGSVTNKASINAPDNPSEKTREVVRGIVRQQESDDNMLQNVSNDSVMPSVDVPVKKSRRERMLEAETRAQKGEINLSSPEQVVVTRVGKGVDNEPMTWEETQKWLKTEQGPSAGIFRYDTMEPHSLEFDPDNAKPYIQIQTASPEAWSVDPNTPGIFDYEGHHPGEHSQAFGGGGYAGVPSSGWSSAESRYFRQFDEKKTTRKPREIIEFSDGKSQDFISYKQDLLAEPKDTFFEKDNKYYKKALELADPNGEIESKIPGYNRTYFTDSITDIGRYIKAFENDEDMITALKLSLESNKDFVDSHLMNEHSFREYNTKPTVLIGEFLKSKDKHYPDEFVKGYVERLDNYKERLKKDLDVYKDLKKNFNFSDKEMIELDNKLAGFTVAEDWDAFFKNLNIDPESLPHRIWDILFSIREDVSEVMFSQSMLDQLKIIKPKLDNLLKKGFTFGEENPLNYKTTLNTHIIQNPEKRLDNLLWWDEDHGIQPLAYFYKGDKAQAAEDIMYEKISSINKDIAKGIYKDAQNLGGSITVPHAGNKNYIFFPGLSLDEVERHVAQLYLDMNQYNRDSLGAWEDLMRRYVYDFLPISEKNKYYDFKDWQSKYLTKKGIDITWHHGNPGSPGNNIVVHNTKMFQPVTKVETDVLNPYERTQYLYNNGHGYESAGDGVGYYGLIVHAPEGSKPVIIKGGKVVDKGDWK